MNKVILIGRLTADPTIRYTQSGTAVANYSLAVNRKFTKDGEREADFISCVAWNKTAEFIVNYFKKGQEMALEGRLQVRSYETDEGQKRWVTEVIVEQVEFVGSKNSNQSNEYEQGSTANSFTGNNFNQQPQETFGGQHYTNNNNFGGFANNGFNEQAPNFHMRRPEPTILDEDLPF